MIIEVKFQGTAGLPGRPGNRGLNGSRGEKGTQVHFIIVKS